MRSFRWALAIGTMAVASFAVAAKAEVWIADADTDCRIWSPEKAGPKTKVSWSGGCPAGKAAGNGVLIWTEAGAELGRFDGTMASGKFHGPGILKYRDKAKTKYTIVRGSFRDGMPNGATEIEGADGSKFSGTFEDGKFDGEGVYVDAAGNRFEGTFKNGVPHGTGYFAGKDGEEFIGDYLQGKRHGLGMLVSADNGIYVGEFKDDVANGSGMVEDKAGGRYHGQFVGGLPSGFGTYVAANGTAYQGTFKNGKPDGTLLVTPKGKPGAMQTWRDGELVK